MLRCGIPVALGSSALTAQGDLLDELLAPRELYRMVTDVPAAILRLDTVAGRIVIGGAADLAVFRDSGRTPAETLLRRSTSARNGNMPRQGETAIEELRPARSRIGARAVHSPPRGRARRVSGGRGRAASI
jgi:adenine deaminase